MKNTLCCLIQNRLGALDRVLGALTLRGFVPERFVSALDSRTQCLQVLLTIECDDEKTLEKLIKYLHKQVHVLEIQLVMADEEAPVFSSPHPNVSPLTPPSSVERVSLERRTASVRNR